tara:strand:- start:2532 stop:3806 length:1275 start_codon:yes stop_codon:yes gene_type:complete
MYEKLLKTLFKIPRSITGRNNRKSLYLIKKIIPIKIKSINSGTKVFDWIVPKEWELEEAWIKDSKGNKVLDVSENYLNIINYSYSINKKLNFEKLKHYLIVSQSKNLNSIPYRTSYYKKKIGFCVSKNQFKNIKKKKDDLFHIYINSKFKKGKLNYGEISIKGKSKKEILISSYICHPNQANDSLSGVIMAIKIARFLMSRKNNFSYRIIFIPETIGALCFMQKNQSSFKNFYAGIVVTTCAGKGSFGIKYSFNKNHLINKLLDMVFKNQKIKRYEFSIRGSDERQYSSPSTRLNVVSIFKDKYYCYKEYHTSIDDLNFVNIKNLNKTFKYYKSLILNLDKIKIYERFLPTGEPMLQKYNLYHSIGGEYKSGNYNNISKIIECLFYTDGVLTSLEVQNILKIKKKQISDIYKLLEKKKLVKQIL